MYKYKNTSNSVLEVFIEPWAESFYLKAEEIVMIEAPEVEEELYFNIDENLSDELVILYFNTLSDYKRKNI